MTYAERAEISARADALFIELGDLLGRLVLTAAYIAEPGRGAAEGVQIVKVAIEGTLNGDELAAIGKYCKRRKISYWGITAHADERGHLFFDIGDFQPKKR